MVSKQGKQTIISKLNPHRVPILCTKLSLLNDKIDIKKNEIRIELDMTLFNPTTSSS